MRSTLHTIFHTLLRSAENRGAVLDFLSKILSANEKRAQFHSEEKKLARDGFMLNILSVLQKLSIKIHLRKVDPNYPFQASSLVSIEKDTKLRFDDNEYKNWIQKGKFILSLGRIQTRKKLRAINIFYSKTLISETTKLTARIFLCSSE